MSTAKLLLLFGLVAMVAVPAPVAADDDDDSGGGQTYRLQFEATHNALDAQGDMMIRVVNGHSIVHFAATGLYPNTVYTIWTVFNRLNYSINGSHPDAKVGSCSANGPDKDCLGWSGWLGFPVEGNGVTPTARTTSGFTSGMGLDPGATFVTDALGNGRVTVRLDYDLVNEAPVSNKDIIAQCVPGPPAPDGKCLSPSKSMRITTTYLRRFVANYPAAEREASCANFDAANASLGHGTDQLYWQCIDPETLHRRRGGVPRIHTYGFDHFRLANHPDGLTHGFIGGNGVDHWIDMVGRRQSLDPPVVPLTPAPPPAP